jgi:hypothetical protein
MLEMAAVLRCVKLSSESAMQPRINDVIPIEAERRLGDPASLCADVTLINKEIGFVAQLRIEASIKSLFSFNCCHIFSSALLIHTHQVLRLFRVVSQSHLRS